MGASTASICFSSNDNTTFGTKQMFYFKIAYKYLKDICGQRCLNSGPLELKYKRFINSHLFRALLAFKTINGNYLSKCNKMY